VIGLLQRVGRAHVEIDGASVGAIGRGLLVLVAVERGDGHAQVERLLERILTYRLFPDSEGRMNLSLADTGGGLLLVPQFTLAADTHKGARPSFVPAAAPEQGELLFKELVEMAQKRHRQVETGHFGANMQVHLVNDGPVTFWLRAAPRASS
jgi:D-tyrosyl-tRNA(Tyr) deacylase